MVLLVLVALLARRRGIRRGPPVDPGLFGTQRRRRGTRREHRARTLLRPVGIVRDAHHERLERTEGHRNGLANRKEQA